MRRLIVVVAVAMLFTGASGLSAGAGGQSFTVTPSSAAPGDEITFVGQCSPFDEVQYGIVGESIGFNLSNVLNAESDGSWTGTAVIPLEAVPGEPFEVGAECGGLLAVFQPFEVVGPDLGQISLVTTVGVDPDACASETEIAVPAGTTVYYCYTVTNDTDLTLDTHSLADDQLGDLFSDLAYDLAPGASVDTVAAGVEASAVIAETTTNTGTWTAAADVQGAAPVVFEAEAQATVTVTAEDAAVGSAAAEPVVAAPTFTG
jgi:hypothetical protein